MLSISRGYDVGYLTDEVGGGREGYYTGATATGEPPGLWYGSGAELLGLAGEVDAEQMKAIYAGLQDPRDPEGNRMLGAPHQRYKTAEERYAQLLAGVPGASPEERAQLWAKAQQGARGALSFYDATFSPPKSWSVLNVAFERKADLARQAGDVEAAQHWSTMHQAVEDAVMAGGRAALDFLQDKAGYSRIGKGGKEWIDAHKFVTAQFLQHDSRDRDPQLHVHQAILNRVPCEDGEWRTIDGKLLFGWLPAAQAIGERTAEAFLERAIGVRAETRPDGEAREIMGVPEDLRDEFSSRSNTIDPAVEELKQLYRERHGHEPNALTSYYLAQQATLDTRQAKSHHGETNAQRALRWAEQAEQRRDGGLDRVAAEALAAGRETTPAARWEPRDVIERAVDALSEKRQSWDEADAMLAVSDALPGNLGIRPEDVRPLLESLTAATVDAMQRLTPDALPVPAEAQLANGASSMARPSPVRYSSAGLLAAEESLRKAAAGRSGVALSVAEATRLVDRFAEAGHELGADQRAAFIGVLTSGASLETISAAAGTGKSFLVGALADAWMATGGRMFGIAETQRATDILADEGLPARNVSAWLKTQQRLAEGRGLAGDGEFRLRMGDHVVLDEASMATTQHLAAVQQACARAGARLTLVGDPHQLGAIGAGGMFTDIAGHGLNHDLAEVRRFQADWEKTVSLRLRAGDPDVLAEYDRRGRLRDGGTADQARQSATRAWLADHLSGKESLLLTASNAEADKAAAALRAELVKLGKVEAEGVWLGRQGTTAGVGDVVRARRLAWDLTGWQGNTTAPVNQATYRVTGLRADGGLSVEDMKTGRPLELPAEYVAKDLQLAYASTVHSAQGATVDTTHSIVGPNMGASDAYVAMSRGRESNTAWTVTAERPEGAGPDAAPQTERDAKGVLADTLKAAEVPMSATAEGEYLAEQDRSVAKRGEDLIKQAEKVTKARVSSALDMLAAQGTLSERDRLRLAADDSGWSLETLLRTAELAGHDIEQVLADAVGSGDFTTAHHPVQALYGRISSTLKGQLTPQVTTAEDLIPRRGLSEAWQEWFSREAAAVDDRRRELGERLAEDSPAWLTERLGVVPDDPIARAEWERQAGWAGVARELLDHDDDADALGPAPRPGLVDKHAVWRNASEALRTSDIGPEEEEASNGRLRAWYRAYEREKAWAPGNVDGPLAATSEALADARTAATLAAAQAQAAVDPGQAAELFERAQRAEAEALTLAGQVEQLEEAADIRGQWFADTAPTREAAYRARQTLDSRGVTLDDPDEQTSAPEWLDAHRSEQAVEDQYREVTAEYELATDAAEEAPTVATLPETGLADIRETSTPDASEDHEQPAERRRVLTVDETAAAVERARDALAELAARQAYEQSREAERAAEAQRSEELARWAEQDRGAAEQRTTDQVDELVSEW